MADMLEDCTIDVRHTRHRVLVVLVFNSVSINYWHMACPLGHLDMTDVMVRHIGHSRERRICREICMATIGFSGKMEAADTTDGGTAITSAVDAAAATTVSVVLAVDDSAVSTEVVAVTTCRDVITIT
ncbi:unnamed protein product [Macrosiphum euphorbiae]|uniref:Uncharacterized protein n=1 Tax=Macrosiphum euphorbiae TaxID=13131 RepID=A0AAV0WQF5_9HEMI|nr:unnamed protein product [Macrosiphum euphorbiae]